jgi:hypothetical protein
LSSSVDATGRGVNVKYDVASRVTDVEEKQGATLDRVRSFTYDTLGRTITETVKESAAVGAVVAPPMRYEYDQAGRIRYERQGTTPTEVLSEMVYDPAGRTQILWRIVNGNARRRIFQYPTNGGRPNLMQVEASNNAATLKTSKTWLRDGLERAATAVDHNALLTTDTSDAALIGSRPQITSTLKRDLLGRVTQETTLGTFPSTSPTLPGQNNVPLGDLNLTYPATFKGTTQVTTRMGEKDVAHARRQQSCHVNHSKQRQQCNNCRAQFLVPGHAVDPRDRPEQHQHRQNP